MLKLLMKQECTSCSNTISYSALDSSAAMASIRSPLSWHAVATGTPLPEPQTINDRTQKQLLPRHRNQLSTVTSTCKSSVSRSCVNFKGAQHICKNIILVFQDVL